MYSTPWREYQEEAADFFRSLGLTAEVGVSVAGARAKHAIDVWVTFDAYGVEWRWVVECKAWKTNIPKEKVEALKSICEDVGANAGFLLSEVGFQPGAEDAARTTNVTLTSIRDLRESAERHLQNLGLDRLHIQVASLQARMRKLSRAERLSPTDLRIRFKPGLQTGDFFWWTANLSSVEEGLKALRIGAFPILYGFAKRGGELRSAFGNHGSEDFRVASDIREFLAGATEITDGAAAWLDAEEQRPWKERGK
jgi:Restriction endonuclease